MPSMLWKIAFLPLLLSPVGRGEEVDVRRIVNGPAPLRDPAHARVLTRIITGDVTITGKCIAPNGLFVTKGATLTINADSVLLMAKGTQLRIEGNLKINAGPGFWAYICGASHEPGFWKGIQIDRLESTSYPPIRIRGLVLSDAERGVDFAQGKRPARSFEIRDSIFAGNHYGVYLYRFGRGEAPLGSFENCVFWKNTEVGLWATKVLEKTPRAQNCSFIENKIGIFATETGHSFDGVTVANRCLFKSNKVALSAQRTEGAVTLSVFEQNGADVVAHPDATIDVSDNYWGTETTKDLIATEGADSKGKVSPKARLVRWLPTQPIVDVGARF